MAMFVKPRWAWEFDCPDDPIAVDVMVLRDADREFFKCGPEIIYVAMWLWVKGFPPEREELTASQYADLRRTFKRDHPNCTLRLNPHLPAPERIWRAALDLLRRGLTSFLPNVKN